MLSDFFTFTVAFRADIDFTWVFAIFGVLVLVNLLKWYKRRV